MNQLQVFISGLILLLPVTGAVDSYTSVQGQVGHPVTLPCNYSTSRDGPVPSCWGRGECRYSYCISSLIWTNGYKVTYQRRNRYQLKGNISEGNVSLTIENTDMSDGGRYCCVVEIPGAFYFGDYLLEVKQENTKSPPTRPKTTRPTTTGRPTTISTRSTQEPTTSTRVSASTPPTPTHTPTHKRVTGAVDSYTSVQGQVGHPVTLPCNYSTSLNRPVPSCWGRGECRSSYCISSLIWTNGYKVTYQRRNQYQLKGNISEGNVSLTIENTDMSDGGRYCCVVEIPGAFYFGDYLLEVKRENTKSAPTRPKTTRPTTTGRPTTISTRSTQEPTSTRVSASTPPTTTHTPTHKRVTGAVDSYTSVQGQVGHPVTLPCNYSTSLNRPVPSCWGQGECRSSYCISSLIWTNGYNVTYQRRNRYQLKGNISEGNVSLTIENTDMSDSGRYCCVVEIPGAFYFGDYLLEVKRDNISSTTFHPNETTAEVTEAPIHSPADWNNTVTSSDDSWNTEAIPPRKLQKNQTQGFYVGIFIAALLLLLLVGSVVITRRTVMKRKCSLRLADFPVSKFGAYQKKVVERARGKDKIYIVEDTPNPEEVLVAL